MNMRYNKTTQQINVHIKNINKKNLEFEIPPFKNKNNYWISDEVVRVMKGKGSRSELFKELVFGQFYICPVFSIFA